VEQNSAGTWCYFPIANQTNSTSCTGGHYQDSFYDAILRTHRHLPQGWSIAYYAADSSLLGDRTYAVPSNGEEVQQCLSGQASDGSYQTMCMSVTMDNTIAEAGAFCYVAVAQFYVSDGCYIAMPNSTTSIATSSS
ncbi:hypothetical protein GGX14DRAFT_329018, partial [Mycena pura]